MGDVTFIDQGAEFSDDRVYRFRLWRRWADGPMLMVVGLNPSTADETILDPTCRRCIGYARRWGFDGLLMMNAFSFRATSPTAMKAAPDTHWPTNLAKIGLHAERTVKSGGAILAAWGNHARHRARWGDVRAYLAPFDVACLGLTKLGQPKHPLYLASDAQPIPYLGDGGRLCREANR